MSATVYVVRAGEHISGIAAKHGFGDFSTIWNHPDNASLRQQRSNPHVLAPGDRVAIPKSEPKQEDAVPEARNRFRVQRRALKLVLVVQDAFANPLPNTRCVVEVDGVESALTTDADGKLELDVAATASQGRVTIDEVGVRFALEIGRLDPIDEPSGWRQRLNNLGYRAGSEDDSESLFMAAIEEYQCDVGEEITGEMSASTGQRLLADHGC